MKTEHTIDPTLITSNSEQLAVLKQHFAHCFDKNGLFVLSRFEEVLQAHEVATTQESYKLDWLGKSYARLLANEPIRTLLSADVAHNSQAANLNSQNLLIKGDNLEVLKHLKGAYREAVKMIYIDPPYNTGSDGFVYQDDRKFTPEQLADLANVSIEEAKRILDFTQRGANSHSAWLTFMYPRLYVAKQLLRDDGVIFISIDDNEQAQLKLLCDEVFGEANFVECITWNKRVPKNDKGIGNIHEYIFIYVKKTGIKLEFLMPKEGIDDVNKLLNKLKNKNINIVSAEEDIRKLYKKNDYDRGITLYNNLNEEYRLWGKINMSWPNADTFGSRYEILHPINRKPVKIPERGWRWTQETFNKEAQIIEGNYSHIKILHDGSCMCGRIWFAKDDNTQPSSITYLDEVESFLLRSIVSLKSDGGIEIENLFDGKSLFSYPKPTTLIKYLTQSTQHKNALILDFFAGSGTTAHAVMQLNAEDSGNRQFICVQLDEKTDQKKEAYKAGYKSIFDITQARIQKAAQKIQTENPNYTGDLGFKLFKTIPIFDNYQQLITQFDPNLELFDGTQLSQQDLANLLTTWQLQHNIPLSQTLNTLDLDGYMAHWFNDTLYLMAQGFDSKHLKAFIQKLDTDSSFTITKLIMFGYNINSKMQREIDEGLKNYRNKKSITLDVVVKY